MEGNVLGTQQDLPAERKYKGKTRGNKHLPRGICDVLCEYPKLQRLSYPTARPLPWSSRARAPVKRQLPGEARYVVIRYAHGNLLEADAEALVNAVNTVGVMGKGIALMFKERFPDNYDQYVAACNARHVQTGKVFVTSTSQLGGPRWIVNFPTKQHWRAPSKMEWIKDGLQDLRKFILEHQVRSIAVPALGAGLGGLRWEAVRMEIERALHDLNDVEVLVFEPITQQNTVPVASSDPRPM